MPLPQECNLQCLKLKPLAGIYLHIPFCKQACHYCNFHFSTSLKLKNDFLPALLKEIRLREDYLQREDIHTVYLGGGTPSLLEERELESIFEVLHRHFPIHPDAEVTLEANPDDLSSVKTSAWKKAGVNRLSIGVQSFFNDDLLWMNRAHDAAQAADSIRLAQAAGISNISIDLIYGTPTLPDNKWEENLHRAAELGIPHLSCYALTVEPGTALDFKIRKKRVSDISNEDQARQFLLMTDRLQELGYEHYEISNLALPGKRSRHNSAYWKGVRYIGLGPSAHSFNGYSRQWNIANNALYIQSLAKNNIPFEIEQLTGVQQYNEYVMTSIRTMEGTDIQHVEQQFGKAFYALLKNNAAPLIEKKWLVETWRSLILTREGKLFADRVAAELFADPSGEEG
ncbi:MAG TPA: radical SAM family heme chaperone HemW [Flavitalea sp.]|nr:radical SAM family heme chaperone HemW [Flavitalea sp.]